MCSWRSERRWMHCKLLWYNEGSDVKGRDVRISVDFLSLWIYLFNRPFSIIKCLIPFLTFRHENISIISSPFHEKVKMRVSSGGKEMTQNFLRETQRRQIFSEFTLEKLYFMKWLEKGFLVRTWKVPHASMLQVIYTHDSLSIHLFLLFLLYTTGWEIHLELLLSWMSPPSCQLKHRMEERWHIKVTTKHEWLRSSKFFIQVVFLVCLFMIQIWFGKRAAPNEKSVTLVDRKLFQAQV